MLCVSCSTVVLTIFSKTAATVTVHVDLEDLCKNLLNQRDSYRFIDKHIAEAAALWAKEAAEDAAREGRQKLWPAWKDELKEKFSQRFPSAAPIWPGDHKDQFDDGLTVDQVLDEIVLEDEVADA